MKGCRLIGAILVYLALLFAFWQAASALLPAAVPFAPTFASSVLLLAPLWFFGFGAGQSICHKINSPILQILLTGLLATPYVVFALPTGQFHWTIGAAIVALSLGLATLLGRSQLEAHLTWQDIAALAVLLGVHLLRLLEPAWPYPGLAALPKLLLVDIVLYLYVVIRNLDGIGYSLVPTAGAVRIGLREWLFFLPLGIVLGTLLDFTRFHPRWPAAGPFVTGAVLTFLFIAMPEELFFRGILQNLLETRLGRRGALALTAVLFGLSHYHRGGTFDWRYLLLAAIAGIFYGRAWRANHQLLASIITHTLVDVVWSVWFR
ncbi:MAG: CPBP family intramembrane metalloprotease domain-containing protein [Acidobacteria bacterium]|nr:MAG: CPBP family intramembrane metalloprotease domain-containing protein [Acidobacteriota bacterium]